MRRILRLWSFTRRTKRRWIGSETPHWAADVYKLCKYFNFLELIPTVAAVLFAPGHFFRRRDRITIKRSFGIKTVYRSPLGFASRITVMLIGLSWLKEAGVSKTQALYACFAVFAALPLAIPVLCALFLCAGGILAAALTASANDDMFDGRGGTLLWLCVPLLPSTYRALRWREYFWSLFYFYGYLLIVPPVVVTLLAALYLAAALLFGAIIAYFDLQPNAGTSFRLWTPVLAAGFWVTARVVVYPYIALLIAAVRPRSPIMMRCEHRDLRVTVKALTTKLKDYTEAVRLSGRKPKKLAKAEALRAEIEATADGDLKQQWRTLQRSLAAEYPASLPQEQREECRLQVMKGFPLAALAEAVLAAPLDVIANHPLLNDLRSMAPEAAMRAQLFGEPALETGVAALATAVGSAFRRASKLATLPSGDALESHYRELLHLSLAREIPASGLDWLIRSGSEAPGKHLVDDAAALEDLCARLQIDLAQYPSTRALFDRILRQSTAQAAAEGL